MPMPQFIHKSHSVIYGCTYDNTNSNSEQEINGRTFSQNNKRQELKALVAEYQFE